MTNDSGEASRDRPLGVSNLLSNSLGNDSEIYRGMAKMSKESPSVDLHGIAEFLSNGSESRKDLVQDMLNAQIPPHAFNVSHLSALESVREMYGSNSSILQTVMRTDNFGEPRMLTNLVDFIKNDTEKRKPLFEQLAPMYENGRIDVDYLKSFEKLSDSLGSDSDALRFILSAKQRYPFHVDIPQLARFVDEWPAAAKPLLDNIASITPETEPPYKLHYYFLEAAAEAGKFVGNDPAKLALVLKLENQIEIREVLNAYLKRPATADRVLQLFVDAKAPSLAIRSLDFDWHASLDSLFQEGTYPGLREKIIAAQPNGQDLNVLSKFVSQSGDFDHLNSALDSGLIGSQFHLLHELKALSRYIGTDPSRLKRAIELNKQGLRFEDLGSMLHEVTVPQILAARELFKSADTPESIKDYYSLRTHLADAKPAPYLADELVPALEATDSWFWHQTPPVFTLSDFIDKDPANRIDMVKRTVAAIRSVKQALPNWLNGVEDLYKQIGGDKNLFEQVLRFNFEDPAELAKFIATDPLNNKAFLERQLSDSSRFIPLTTQRIEKISELTNLLDNDRNIERRLREFLNLDGMLDFMHNNPDKKSFLIEFIQKASLHTNLSEAEIISRYDLRSIFKDDPSIAVKLEETDPSNPNFLPEMVRFIRGETVREPGGAKGEAERKAVVENLVSNDSDFEILSPTRLAALADLEHQFGPNSEVMKVIRTQEKENIYVRNIPSEVSLLSSFAQTEFGKNFIERLPEDAALQSSVQDIRSLISLNEHLRPNQDVSMRLVRLIQDGLYPRDLVSFVKDGDGGNAAMARNLIEQGANAKQLDSDRLTALSGLNKSFANDPDTLKYLMKLETEGLDLEDIDFFVRYVGNSSGRAELLANLAKAKASIEQFSYPRLEDLDWLHTQFGSQPATEQQILGLESKGLSIGALREFVEGCHNAIPRIKAMLKNGESFEGLSGKALRQRGIFSELFGDDTPNYRVMMSLCKEGTLVEELVQSLAFLDNPTTELNRMIEDGVDASDIVIPRLEQLVRIYREFGSQPELIRKIRRLEKDGLNLGDLAKFITERPSGADLVSELATKGYTARQLSSSNMTDIQHLDEVARKMDPSLNAGAYLRDLQRKGLSGVQLEQYIQERPTARKTLVENLIKEGADSTRLKNQMRLIAFPDDVAYILADKADRGGMKVLDIIGNLRDWKSGQDFWRLVIDQVRNDRPIEESDMQSIAQHSRTMSVTSDSAAGTKSFGNLYRSGIASGDSTDNLPAAASTPEIDGGAWAVGFRRPSATTMQIADSLTSAVDRLAAVLPKDKPIVLLGRDAWPLLPLIRARGFDTQYFLWGRGNKKDPNTYAQWLKEVKPNAAVIDTGYKGTVLNWIRDKDVSATGLLLSKNHDVQYDQILIQPDHKKRTTQIETLVKYTNRSKTYTAQGGAKLFKGFDQDDGAVARKYTQFDGVNRWEAQADVRDLFRAAGLSPWETWRYSSFVGLTPEERIGLNSRAEVLDHYRAVEEKRRDLGFMFDPSEKQPGDVGAAGH